LDFLIAWDIALFRILNGWHSAEADAFMYLVSERWPWIPGYLLLLVLAYRQVGPRRWGLMFVGLLLLIAFTDRISAGVIKPSFERKRPCHAEAELGFEVHVMPDDCGGRYGFVSSHAANFFGLATFFSLFFGGSRARVLLFSLATLVSYSRIYLGVHYPADVLGGAFLGLLGGWLIWQGYRWASARWLGTSD
jgi:undecaprenyl-diphosphatase